MIDDHDRCEWVNVSSGTIPAHPGCPGQNQDTGKTVVCVCVCVNNSLNISSVLLSTGNNNNNNNKSSK